MVKLTDPVLNDRAMGLGYCPQCGANSVWRERRPNGDDTCEKGHVYPSKDALSVADVVTKIEPPDPGLAAQINRDDKTAARLDAERAFNSITGHPIGEIDRVEAQMVANIGQLQGRSEFDQRMLAIAKTQIELGFLALNRALKRI